MPPKAILIDFDGVVADLENYHVAAWQRTLGFMGLTIADEVAARGAEGDDRAFLTELFAAREIPTDKVDEWIERKRALAAELLRYAPRVFPGVVALAGALDERARLAAVSDTFGEDVVEAVLIASGLADPFDAIIARPDVTRPGPDPQAYALALKEFRRSASSVAAIVGSPPALSAARAAGIGRLIAVGHRRPFGDWVGDAAFVEKLEPVERVLEPLGFLAP
jgi:beta-phosphoglucomutase-like phosphatase (HAD superfamily)